MVACGGIEPTRDDTRSESQFQFADNGLSFSLAVPSEPATAIEQPIEPTLPPEPPPTPNSRILLSCRKSDANTLFTVGLTEQIGNAIGFESAAISGCLKSIDVKIVRLSKIATYTVNGNYELGELLTHKGTTEPFTLGARQVSLFMKKIPQPDPEGVIVDVTFAE